MIGKRYAIIVGSNNYEMKTLDYTFDDVKSMQKALTDKCKFETIISIELTTKTINSRDEITTAFNEIKKSLIKKTDTFLFYFSGHGIYDNNEETSFIELSDTEKYSIREIYQKITSIDAKNSYLIIDACYSGGKVKSKSDRKHQYNSNGIYCIFATSKDKKAQEGEKHIKNGVFTHYFIECLNTKAKYTNGVITIKGIEDYVSITVPKYTDFKQIPVSHSETLGTVEYFAFWDEKEKIMNSPQTTENTEEELLPIVTKTYHYGVSYNSKKQPIITVDTIEFFNHRIRTAFGDYSGLKDYSASEGVARLVKCLEDPILFYNEEENYNSPEMTKYDNPYRKIIRQPIWFFRDGTFSIKKITKQTDTKILLYDQFLQYGNSCYQVEISKVVAFISNRPYQNLIYIEVQAEQPLDDMYSYKSGQIEETYVVYDGEVLPQKDIDNSEIYRNGKLITIISSKKEEITRYIKPSNFIIGEQFGRWDDYSPSLNKILKGEMTLQELIEKVKRKERNDFEWEV